jgi:F-type H+-transporting ATPase subunit b
MLDDPTFWVLIAFLIFFGLVGKKAYAAATAGLDTRAQRIKQEIDEAQRLREEAQALLANFQRRQREAVKEAEAIVAHAREEAELLRKDSGAALQTALRRREEVAMEKIAQAEAAAVTQVRDLTVDLALAATRAVLAQHLEGKRGDALVDAAIKELPGKLN